MIAMRGGATRAACDHGWVRRLVGISVVVLSLAMPACLAESPIDYSSGAGAAFESDGTTYRTGFLTVADSAEERRQGLMGVDDLAGNDGMVFVFDGEQDGSFWMKDTLIPLSIAFWGDDGRVVDILELEPCTADPCPMYSARATYTHALEMNAHWFEDRGIEIGDRVELTIADE
jgi:uncharacterized membrane protein (UPF0127 family)